MIHWFLTLTLLTGNVESIVSMLDNAEQLCGDFEQTKTLAGIRKPLISKGRFCIVAKKGVLWRTLTPFDSSIRIQRDSMVQMQGERVVKRLEAAQEPFVRTISDVLFATLAGDFKQLESLFDLHTDVQKNAWHVALKAHNSGLQQALGDIVIEGDAHVKHIVFTQPNGDRTNLVFSHIVTGAQALRPEEKKSFE